MNRPSSFSWRPATTYVLIGGLVVLLMGVAIASMLSSMKPTTPVQLAGNTYQLWVADTEEKRVQGLSGVERLDPNGGLLMKFDSDGQWGIWMKDMKVPLDIIWLDKNKKVVYIVKNAKPELSTDTTFTPKSPARYVIELPAGSVDRSAINQNTIGIFDENDPGSAW